MATKVKPTDHAYELRKEIWDSFEAGWRKSKKGNLWKHFEGLTLTVFKRADGWFSWCASDGHNEAQFSHGGYVSQSDAIIGLGEHLCIG